MLSRLHYLCLNLILLSEVYCLEEVKECNIIIAGGSLSSLAAAITASNISSQSARVCYLEPTDWPGGQLVSSNVPPDFGTNNSSPENLPNSFVQLLQEVVGPEWDTNPGMCWVSTKCFHASLAAHVVKRWLDNVSLPLKVYYNTVVSDTKRNENGDIVEIVAIQRSYKGPRDNEWNDNLSVHLADWYSAADSDSFFKRVLSFKAPHMQVVIEATEFGDVLMTSGVDVVQGYEYPDEHSDLFNSHCGQEFVLPFNIAYGKSEVDASLVPAGSDGGVPVSLAGLTWNQSWTYRRVVSVGVDANEDTLSSPTVNKGEQSNQNLGNDYPSAYFFLPLSTSFSARQSPWSGGVNTSALAAAEQRSYAYYHYIRDTAASDVQPFLGLNYSEVGTRHGLSKMPYLRESRRPRYGLDGFKLFYDDISIPDPRSGAMGNTARYFHDRVGLGDYHYADVHRMSDEACGDSGYPPYLAAENHPVIPYYIPFRALTCDQVGNLLVSGKSMAQSFLANAGTRLHPSEWSSGVAAGAAAVLMIRNNWSSRDVYEHIRDLQDLLKSDEVRSPIEWTSPP